MLTYNKNGLGNLICEAEPATYESHDRFIVLAHIYKTEAGCMETRSAPNRNQRFYIAAWECERALRPHCE